jgi:hypothetical protein
MLFTEVLDKTLPGSGTTHVGQADIVQAWLVEKTSVLVALASLGRAAVRKDTSNRDTMILDFMTAMHPISNEILRWLGEWKCLSELTSPAALSSLSNEECRAKFEVLATLDAGL